MLNVAFLLIFVKRGRDIPLPVSLSFSRLSSDVTNSLVRVLEQMAYSLAKVGGLWEYLGHKERLSLLLSALCHDVDHPGVSGAYLHKARARLATWFRGDPGLLEKHHSVRTFELLARNHVGLLAHLPSEDRAEVLCLIRDAILATDMSQHVAILADLEANLPPGPDSAMTARNAEPRQRLRWLQVCMQL